MDTQFETITGKRGSGKTFKALTRLTDAALLKEYGYYLFVGPGIRSHELMTNILAEHPFPLKDVTSISKTHARIGLRNGATIQFRGENQIEPLRGLRYDGAVADATECWENRNDTMALIRALLNPDGFTIETRFE